MTIAINRAQRWVAQRVSAMVLAVCVLLHLGIMIYAVQGGLSAHEIMGRTQGNWFFGALYTVFVLACALHVPLGLAAISEEWLGWRGRTLAIGMTLLAGVILVMGLRSVFGMVAA